MRWVVFLLCSCGRFGFEGTDARKHDVAQTNVDAPKLVADAPVLALDAGQCPSNYAFTGTSCYRVSAANAGWLLAEVACEGEAVGAHLVVIDDATEYATVMSLSGIAVRTWIGLSKRASAAFLTVINTSGYRDLTSSQTEASEDCATIDTTGHMGTHTCTDLDRYICEYDGVAAVPASY